MTQRYSASQTCMLLQPQAIGSCACLLSREQTCWLTDSSVVVHRLVDEMGQPIGPFRVWLQYAWIPGLAMSRALGDAVAHS